MVETNRVLERAEVRSKVKACTYCDLVNHCRKPVPFSGPTDPKLVVVGEAPGKQEDEQGAPFVGPSGSALREILRHVGWDIEREVAFVNAVSCFPNRTPSPEEVTACRGNLLSQLSFLSCDRLLVVGGVATGALIKTSVRMGEVRGLWFRPDRLRLEGTWAFSTWHPSAVLRNKDLEFEQEDDISYMTLMIRGDHEPTLGQFCVKCPESNPQVTYASDIPFCGKHKPKGS